MRLADDARKSVIFFGVREDGKAQYRGTGFLIQHRESPHSFNYLVTARHIANGLPSAGFVIRVNTSDGGSEELEQTSLRWTVHPTFPR